MIAQVAQRLGMRALGRAHIHGNLHQLGNRLLGALRVHAQQRRVLVAGEKGAHRVRQVLSGHRRAVLRRQVGSRPGHAVPLAQQRLRLTSAPRRHLDHHEGQRVGVGPALRLERHGDAAERILVILRCTRRAAPTTIVLIAEVNCLVSGGTIAPLSGCDGRCPKVLSAISTSYG